MMAEKDEYAMARCLDEHALMISKQVLPFRVYTEFPRVQLNPLLLMAEILLTEKAKSFYSGSYT
jgi:hypothetical protein